MAKKKKPKVKKVVKVDIVASAIKLYKRDNKDWKKQDQDDLYAIESYIDALLYEKKYAGHGYLEDGKPSDNSELILERLTFKAIQKMQGGRRHTCDMLYDDAFGGYDGF